MATFPRFRLRKAAAAGAGLRTAALGGMGVTPLLVASWPFPFFAVPVLTVLRFLTGGPVLASLPVVTTPAGDPSSTSISSARFSVNDRTSFVAGGLRLRGGGVGSRSSSAAF